MRYLAPDMLTLVHWAKAYGSTWSDEKFLRQGFNMNGRTYIVRPNSVMLHIAGIEWVYILDDKWLPPGVRQACFLWLKNNYSLTIHEFLDKMFGE